MNNIPNHKVRELRDKFIVGSDTYMLLDEVLERRQDPAQFTHDELKDIAATRGIFVDAMKTQVEKLQQQLEERDAKIKELARDQWKIAAYDKLRADLKEFVRGEFYKADIWPDDEWDN